MTPQVNGVGTQNGGWLILCNRESREGTVKAFYSSGS